MSAGAGCHTRAIGSGLLPATPCVRHSCYLPPLPHATAARRRIAYPTKPAATADVRERWRLPDGSTHMV